MVEHSRKEKRALVERHIRNRILPAAMTALSIAIVAYMLHVASLDILQASGLSVLIFASFASSAFVLFMTPRSRAAFPKKFVKSYFVAALVGYAGLLLTQPLGLYVAAFIVIFLVSLLLPLIRAEHPPAVGIAFAFLIFRVGISGIVTVILGVALLIFVRYFLERAVYLIEEEVEDVEAYGRDHRKGAMLAGKAYVLKRRHVNGQKK